MNRIRPAAVALALILTATGCAGLGASDEDASAETAAATTDIAAADAADDGVDATTSYDPSGMDNQESHFDADDLDYDPDAVVSVSLDGDTASADDAAVVVDGSTVTITAAGTYSLSGSLDGEILVDAGDTDDVILILDGVDITHDDGAAIAVLAADEAVVLLADGTTNHLTDGAEYTFPDAETDEPNATLYSAADLTIAGDGELVIDGLYNDGIGGKDGLVIVSGTIQVTAIDDGVRGKDYVIVDGGTITVDAGGRGVKADNDEDPERGYVELNDGVLDIVAGDDGIHAATDVSIAGGELTIAAGDDAVHGDYLVTVTGGSITITEAYEGIEAETIVIDDGVIDITSSDDGLNVAAADAATTATADVGRGAPGESVGDYYLYVNGGTITITIVGDLDEQGDGIDANGHVVMTGGTVAVSGPTDTRNSALDYSGGTFEMTGGVLIGTNIDGRNSEGIGTGSTQASLYLTAGSTIEAGTTIEITDGDGTSLVTFEPANDYSVIVFSSPDLVDGGSYDVYLGGEFAGAMTATL